MSVLDLLSSLSGERDNVADILQKLLQTFL
jgi:hypothetical protein